MFSETPVIPSFGPDQRGTCSGIVPVLRARAFLSSFIVFPSDDGGEVKETNDGGDSIERFLGDYELEPG